MQWEKTSCLVKQVNPGFNFATGSFKIILPILLSTVCLGICEAFKPHFLVHDSSSHPYLYQRTSTGPCICSDVGMLLAWTWLYRQLAATGAAAGQDANLLNQSGCILLAVSINFVHWTVWSTVACFIVYIVRVFFIVDVAITKTAARIS